MARRLPPSRLVAASLLFVLSSPSTSEAQELNDPSRNYIKGSLGNRPVFWCPTGYGYLAYCPQVPPSLCLSSSKGRDLLGLQPTDWENYNWCCSWPYMDSWRPSCCPFAIPTGAVVAVVIAAILLLAVLFALSCWCCYCCPLYKQLYHDY